MVHLAFTHVDCLRKKGDIALIIDLFKEWLCLEFKLDGLCLALIRLVAFRVFNRLFVFRVLGSLYEVTTHFPPVI